MDVFNLYLTAEGHVVMSMLRVFFIQQLESLQAMPVVKFIVLPTLRDGATSLSYLLESPDLREETTQTMESICNVKADTSCAVWLVICMHALPQGVEDSGRRG